MPIFPPTGLGEALILELRHGPQDVQALIDKLCLGGHKATKQGAYKALRFLRAREMVFLQAGKAFLNLRWLERLEHFVSLTQHTYADPASNTSHLLNIEDGERIVYSFKNPISLDGFLNDLFYSLLEALPNLDHCYSYASHNWFLLAHREEELSLYRRMNKRGVRVLYTVAHTTPLDRLAAKDFNGDMMQYHMAEGSTFFTHRKQVGLVVHIIGDFVIQAEYEERFIQAIDLFYSKNTFISAERACELNSIISTFGRTKLVITRHEKKAQKFRRRLERNFFVPTQVSLSKEGGRKRTSV